MDKTSSVTYRPTNRFHLRHEKGDKQLIEEYIYGKFVKIVDKNSVDEIARTFQDSPEEKVELYQNTIENKSRLFKGKKGDIVRAKYTIGFSELLNYQASQCQLECWSDLFVWLEENGLPSVEVTSGFIELARLEANDEETELYKRIALVFLDTLSDTTGEVRETNLREATKNMIHILQQTDISSEVKEDLLDEEIRKANDFANEEYKRNLQYIGKLLLVGGSITAKVATALALLL